MPSFQPPSLILESITDAFVERVRKALAKQSYASFEHYYAPQDRWFENKVYHTTEGGVAIRWREVTALRAIEEGAGVGKILRRR